MPGNKRSSTTSSPLQPEELPLPLAAPAPAAAVHPQEVPPSEIRDEQPDGEAEKTKGVATDLIDERPDDQQNYLLLIALDYYKDPQYNLTNPVRDANALLETLLKRYKYAPKEYKPFETEEERKRKEEDSFTYLKDEEQQAGKNRYGDDENYRVFNSDRIVCLYNEEATVDNIDTALNNMIDRMEDNSQLLIYYSGHGFRDKNQADKFTLTSHFFEKGKRSTYLPLDILVDKGMTEKCRNLLLIVDACSSGAAIFGNKSEGGDAFSREILGSCSAVELASDGRSSTGSPFSRELVKLLRENVQANKLGLNALGGHLDERVRLATEGREQNITYGKAPSFRNGAETYRFELADNRSPDVRMFAESIINFMNFKQEREFFTENDFTEASKNKDYYILSSLTTNTAIEKLRGKIISKAFARTLRLEEPDLFQLKRFPLFMLMDMSPVNKVEDIFDLLGKKVNLENIGADENDSTIDFNYPEKVKYFAERIGRNLKTQEDEQNPLCIGFIVSNLLPAKHDNIIAGFIMDMVKGIEKYKNEPDNQNNRWDRLIFYIISKTEENVLDCNCFSESSSRCVIDLFKSERLPEPFFNQFEKLGFIRKTHIRDWLTKTGNLFDAEAYKAFYESHRKITSFPKEDNLTIDAVLYKLADKMYDSDEYKRQLFDLLFLF